MREYDSGVSSEERPAAPAMAPGKRTLTQGLVPHFDPEGDYMESRATIDGPTELTDQHCQLIEYIAGDRNQPVMAGDLYNHLVHVGLLDEGDTDGMDRILADMDALELLTAATLRDGGENYPALQLTQLGRRVLDMHQIKKIQLREHTAYVFGQFPVNRPELATGYRVYCVRSHWESVAWSFNKKRQAAGAK